jgi:alcohol dehydrogenase (cytochrome c)
MRYGIAEPNKNGYVYYLDRQTGKPIFPITEKPVPQSEDQKTSATQPIPEMPPFSPQKVSPKVLKALKASMKSQIPEGQKQPKVLAGKLYDIGVSRTNSVKAVAPAASGGVVHAPSSYNPDTQMYYVCSQSASQAVFLNDERQKYKRGTTFTGPIKAFAFTGFNSAPGFVTAYDMTTGKIAWQNKWDESACYSATSTTAGGLVFVGHNEGELEALDAETGESLWKFQTGAGANTTASFYEHQGKQYVAFLAGGTSSSTHSRHGDELHAFALP